MNSEQNIDQVFVQNAVRARDAHRRHSLAFVASVAAHALILVALVFLLPVAERPHHNWVLAYLVEFGQPGGGGSGATASEARGGSARASAHPAMLAALPHTPAHAHRRAARPQVQPERVAPQIAAVKTPPVSGDSPIAARSDPVVPAAAGAGSPGVVASASAGGGFGAGGGSGGGNGSGDGDGNGSGSASAHAEYGQNPGPTYPVEARRRAEQGTVLLRIEVGADGSVERVEIAESSGFDLLDRSALETVRTRWRFVPARRDGIAVESWCQVPIRFALTEARAG